MGSGAVIQADLDGSNGTTFDFNGLLTGAGPQSVVLNVAGDRMYVVGNGNNNARLFSANLNGANGTMIALPTGLLNAPLHLVLDLVDNKIYISNSGNNTIARADLPDGANPIVLNGGQPITTVNRPTGLAVFRP